MLGETKVRELLANAKDKYKTLSKLVFQAVRREDWHSGNEHLDVIAELKIEINLLKIILQAD